MKTQKVIAWAVAVILLCSSGWQQSAYAGVTIKKGTEYEYYFRETITVTNNTGEDMVGIRQKLLVNKETDSPYQTYLHVDYSLLAAPDGTKEIENKDSPQALLRILNIPVLKNGESISYVVTRRFVNAQVAYEFEKTGESETLYNNEAFEEYLQPAFRIESDDPIIVDKTKEVLGGETNPYEMAKKYMPL